MAAKGPLRRWKRFFSAFDAVDDAIEASDPSGGLSRAEFRSERGGIIEVLCGAEDDGVAEEVCLLLDGVMEESLVTLRMVPVAAAALASTDLARAVGALGEHESDRVRGLSRDLVRRWRASVEADLARASAAMEELDKICAQDLPLKSDATPVARSCCATAPTAAADEADKKRRPTDAARTTTPASTSRIICGDKSALKSGATPVARSFSTTAPTAAADEAEKKRRATDTARTRTPASTACIIRADKMEATKRKLRDGYRELEDAKRQRKIQFIEAPKIPEPGKRKVHTHPIMRRMSRVRCASSTTAARRSLLSTFERI